MAQLSTSAAVVRFIESRFDPEKTSQQIRSVLGEARDWTDSPTGPEVFGKISIDLLDARLGLVIGM